MKKNVLQLIPSFHQGGSERQALQLTRLLLDDGTYDLKLACLDKNGFLLGDEIVTRIGSIPEFPLTSFYDANMIWQLRDFVRYLRSNMIDVIQTHDFYTNIFGMVGARIAGVPVRIAAKRETGMRTRAQLFMERRAFGAAGRVIVNSERVKDYLVASGVPADKLEVVYNGIEQSRFNGVPDERAALLLRLGLPKNFRFVTIVANLRSSVKNHEMFLRAAKMVSDRVGDAAFVIAGEGERMRLITLSARDLGLSERTFFLGRCPEVPELLAVSEICVLTSDSEGFSNSIIEYMAAGRPVVATDVGGAGEAIVEGKTGFLVAPNDDAALADRLCLLLENRDLCERFGNAGRQRVVEHFSTKRQLEKTLAVYERELSGAPR